MFYFPTDPIKCAEAAHVLGIRSPEERKKLWIIFVAIESHHGITAADIVICRSADGKWQLCKGILFNDDDDKRFSFPPQNANVQQFIDGEVLSSGLS